MKSPTNSCYHSREQLTRAFMHDFLLRRGLERLAESEPAPGATGVSVDKSADADAGQSQAAVARPDLEELLPGQIRLLAQPEELVWVLTLRAWGGGAWLVVPFSPFSSPATDEEYRLGGGRTEYLDVLQFWNTRTVNALFLRRSWLVDTLTPEEMRRAEILFDCSLTGADVPDDLLAHTGLPIVSADDPRLDYKSESLARFTGLDGVDLQLAELCGEAATRPVANVVANARRKQTALAVTESLDRRPPALPKLFSPLPLAAAGRNEVSVCWTVPSTASALLARLCRRQNRSMPAAATDVKQQAAGWLGTGKLPLASDMTPVLMWEWPDNQDGRDDGKPATADALFFHRQNKTLLATGYALREHGEGTIVLADWVVDEHPQIDSPSDITIFLTAPEEI